MSYIPKYILKRLIPDNAVKLDGQDLKIQMVNVIQPIPIEEVPEDLLKFIEVKIDNEVVIDAQKKDAAEQMKIQWQDKVFTLKNVKEAQGLTLPVGGTLTIILPNTKGLKVGEMHKFSVLIKADNPINVEFDRKVSQ